MIMKLTFELDTRRNTARTRIRPSYPKITRDAHVNALVNRTVTRTVKGWFK
jgi:hypothetical protein